VSEFPHITPAQAEAARVIDALGGTGAVARLFSPPIRPASVSGWKASPSGIPAARREILRLRFPDLFDADAARAAA
jgi:hypothetical protein